MGKMFELDPDMDLLFSLPSVEQLIKNKELLKKQPDVLLMDIELPGISGIEALSIVRKFYPNTDMVMVTGSLDENFIWRATISGARGYLVKPLQFAQLKDQIRQIRNGGTLISPEAASVLVRKLNGMATEKTECQDDLTKREMEVVNYFLKGFSYKQIAVAMQISASTVNDHQKRIYKKLNINSKYELIARMLHTRTPNIQSLPGTSN
jgi:DNA-binding NarL/FixJ family response regulator